MARPLSLQFRTDDPGNSFATVVESYNDHLQTGRYGPRYRRYVASVVHFGRIPPVEAALPGEGGWLT